MIRRARLSFYPIVAAAAVLICAASGLAQDKVGTSAAPFLGISIGPRAASMGGAYVAQQGDATSLYWNPAGIGHMTRSHVQVSHSEWIIDTDFNWAGIVLVLDNANVIGFSATQLDYGEQEVTDELNQTGTGAIWSASDLAVALTYARGMTDRFSIGGTFKLIQQKIWNETATAMAVDLGLVFITQFDGLRLGMNISNFGSDLKFQGKDLLRRIDLDPGATGNNETITSELKTDAWPLPLFFRVGVAYDLVKGGNSRFTVAADAVRPSDNSGVLNLGGEVALYDLLYLRGGYQSLFRDSAEEGLAFGVGLRYNAGSAGTLNFDFSYADYGLLENVNTFSVGLAF